MDTAWSFTKEATKSDLLQGTAMKTQTDTVPSLASWFVPTFTPRIASWTVKYWPGTVGPNNLENLAKCLKLPKMKRKVNNTTTDYYALLCTYYAPTMHTHNTDISY